MVILDFYNTQSSYKFTHFPGVVLGFKKICLNHVAGSVLFDMCAPGTRTF